MQIRTDPDYLQRFGLALENLGIGTHDRVMLAVSGGPDSLALLLLANQAMPGRIHAATVDHQLRIEAADEANFVSRLCSDLAVPHITLTPSRPIDGNIQSAARAVRYQLLEHAADDRNCSFIATAHHHDDQLETLLMRLARGSGIDGFAAIRAHNKRIIRPLLGFSKSELEEICAARGIAPVRDPSNDDSQFDRVRIRQWLARAPHPFATDRAQRSAKALGEAAEALAWMTDSLAADRIAIKDAVIQCDARALPAELKRRLLVRCLAHIEPDRQPRGDALDHVLAELDAGRTAMIGNVLCKGGPLWTFSVAPPRRTGR